MLGTFDADVCRIFDGEIPEETGKEQGILVIDHFHNWVRQKLSHGDEYERAVFAFIENHPDCVIICDEIGNGIVPMDPFERTYRENTGRLLIELAKKAEEVERVICGIGQKIK